MKNKVIPVTECLFHGELGEKVSYGAGGDPIKVSTKRIVTPALTVTARVGTNSNSIVMSRAPEAVNVAEETARDNEFVFGKYLIAGTEYLWKTDGAEEVWTNYDPKDPDNDDKYNARRAALYPLVVKREKEYPDMSGYREKVKNGTATADMAYRFSDAFYYGYAVNGSHRNITINFGIPETDLKPEDPVAPLTVTVNGDSILPWKSSANSSISNDFSVESARKGKYRLNWAVTEVVESDDRYDFRNDILPLLFLDGYVDNDTFRSVLQTVVLTINNMVRANRIDETVDCPVNELIAGATIASIARNILLVGEPGTGKTMLLSAIACALGMPIAIIRLNQHSEADALTEEIRVTTNGFSAKKSKMYWYCKFGGIIVLDDMTNAETNILFGTLGGTLEAPYKLSVGPVDVPRHPMCFITATANIGTEGSRNVNEALISRFGQPEVVEKLDDDAFKRCIVERARLETGVKLPSGTEKALINWVYDAYNSSIASIEQFSADLAEKVVTLRAAISLYGKFAAILADGFKLNPAEEAIKAFANPLYAAGEEECRDVVAKSIESMSTSTLTGLI